MQQTYKAFYEMDRADKIMAFEQGDLQDCEIIALFQELLDSGIVWQLHGSYGRLARQLIEAGFYGRRKHRKQIEGKLSPFPPK
jgi:hypothetical protein